MKIGFMTFPESKKDYTRISTILYPFTGLEKIPQDIVEKAAERGTKVHKACESIVLGLGNFGIDREVEPYIDSFNQWWELGHQVYKVEERFYDDELKITGQADLLIQCKENSSFQIDIIDLKTSYKPSKTWPIQGAAYAYLAQKNGLTINKIHFLHLSKVGKFPKICTYPVNDKLFLSVFETYNHFYKVEKK